MLSDISKELTTLLEADYGEDVREAIKDALSKINNNSIPAVEVTGIKGDAESEYRKGDVNISKANIGLDNVDNTSDINKPISNSTLIALNKKLNISNIKNAKPYLKTVGSEISFNYATSDDVLDVIVYGKSIQNGSPLPSNPAEIAFAGSSGAIQITVNNKPIMISTPNGLLGIPVESDGNYVDTNGQHWICDSIDKRKRKLIKRVSMTVLDGSGNWTKSATADNVYVLNNFNNIIPNVKRSLSMITNLFSYTKTTQNIIDTMRIGVSGSQLIVCTGQAPTLEDFITLLNEHNLVILYELPEYIENDLSLSQLAALDKIKTSNGTISVIVNDPVNPELIIGIPIPTVDSISDNEDIYFDFSSEYSTKIEYITDTDVVINAEENTRYICGEVSTLDFIPSSTGIASIQFTSGSSKTILTLPNTVKMPDWFEIEANTTYEISIADGVYGVVTSWAV